MSAVDNNFPNKFEVIVHFLKRWCCRFLSHLNCVLCSCVPTERVEIIKTRVVNMILALLPPSCTCSPIFAIPDQPFLVRFLQIKIFQHSRSRCPTKTSLELFISQFKSQRVAKYQISSLCNLFLLKISRSQNSRILEVDAQP